MPVVSKVGKHKPKKAGALLADDSSAWFNEDDGIKMSLYGRSGTGKTTLWGTFPGTTLAFICSGGTRKPGELRSVDTPANRKRIKPVVIRKPGDFKAVLDELKSSSKTYDNYVLDNGSGLQDLVLADILELDEMPAQKSWGIAKQQDWGQCALVSKEIMRSLLSLKGNVIIVAHERNFNDDNEGKEFLTPTVGSALMPSLTNWLNGACDYIVQTFIRQKEVVKEVKVAGKVKKIREKTKGVEYCLRTAPDPVYLTKFRSPLGSSKLPDVIVDPSYDKIMKLIQQGG